MGHGGTNLHKDSFCTKKFSNIVLPNYVQLYNHCTNKDKYEGSMLTDEEQINDC